MIKPFRCRCGLTYQRRHLIQAVESDTDIVCPTPACLNIMTVAAIQKLLIANGDLHYKKPTQAAEDISDAR